MNELITGLNGGNVPALDIIMLLTFAALLPSIVVMMSSFMRIIIILSFTRNAMGVQQTPPNMGLTGMALVFAIQRRIRWIILYRCQNRKLRKM